MSTTPAVRSAPLARLFDPAQVLVSRLDRAYREVAAKGQALPSCVLAFDGGLRRQFGTGQPAFEILVHDREGLAALTSFDETRVGEALMSGSLDIEGNFPAIFRLRSLSSDRHPFQALWYKVLHPLIFGQVASDKKWVAQHYDEDADFYLLFLDRQRCYSHGVFDDEGESLDDAMRRKLDFALASTGIAPGQRLLDIGAGWGTMIEHAGRRGIEVTSLTISRASERFCSELIARDSLPCRVIQEHLLEYRPEEKFDAIINMGVTEHLPDYRATLAQYQRLLKPGGRVYLDSCSSRTKFPFSSFTYRYVFPGNTTPLCLHDYLTEVAETPFEVVAVYNDRRSYELTCRHWAENLERSREEIVRRWGKSWFRRFQLYLWGCVDVFARDVFGAYRVVLELPAGARA